MNYRPAFLASLALRIVADSQKEADGIAHGAAAHLRETFNDDGTLRGAELIPTDTTPGAWVSERPKWTDPRCTRHIYDSAGQLIARVDFANRVQSEAEAIANAELIAAAPTMREALAAAVAYVELYTGNGCQKQPPAWALAADGDGFDAETIAARGRLALARAGAPSPGPLPAISEAARNAEAFDVLRELAAYSWLDPTGTECDETFAGAKRRGLALVEKPYPVPAKSEPRPSRVFDRAAAPELFTVFAGNAQFAHGHTLMCAGPMVRGETLADLDWSDAGDVENFQDGADVMERICTLLGARFRDPGERLPEPDYADLNDEPPLYVVFKGYAFFACTVPGFVGDLQAAYIEDDGSIDWQNGVVDVDPFAIERDEEETIAAICTCLDARYPGN